MFRLFFDCVLFYSKSVLPLCCQSQTNTIMKRITEKHLTELLQEVADYSNNATSKKDAVNMGKGYFLAFEYASEYGGWRLIGVNAENGGHLGVFGYSASEGRISAKEMYIRLEGILKGLKYSRVA